MHYPLNATPLLQSSLAAEDEQAAFTDGPWISSVAWLDDAHVVGTSSQGLLLRPAQVVKAAVDSLSELQPMGEAETSLWCVANLGEQGVLASDYKGHLAIYGDGDPKPLEIEARWIRAMAAAADGQLLAGTEDGKLLVLSAGDHKEEKRIEASTAAIFDLAFNADGNLLAVACGDGTIKMFSWPALEEKSKMSRSSEAVWSIAFSNDGTRLISGGADRRLQLWDVATARSLGTITKTPDWVTSLVALPDSNLVVAGCMNGQMVIADYDTLARVDLQAAAESGIWALSLSPDNTRIAAGTRKHGFAVMPIAEWVAAGKQAAEEAKKIRPPAPNTTSPKT